MDPPAGCSRPPRTVSSAGAPPRECLHERRRKTPPPVDPAAPPGRSDGSFSPSPGSLAALTGLLHLPPVQRAATRAATREAARVLGSTVEAGLVRWNALSGTLEARDLLVRGEGERAGTEISVSRARVQLSVRDLVRGRVVVEGAVLERPGASRPRCRGPAPLPVPDPPDRATRRRPGRPDVEIRELRLSDGVLELTDRGKAARRIDVKGIGLEGSLGLRDLASSGSLTLGTIDVAASGDEPLRGSPSTTSWKTRGEIGTAKARLVAKGRGSTPRSTPKSAASGGTPVYTATLTTEGIARPPRCETRAGPRSRGKGRRPHRRFGEGFGASVSDRDDPGGSDDSPRPDVRTRRPRGRRNRRAPPERAPST